MRLQPSIREDQWIGAAAGVVAAVAVAGLLGAARHHVGVTSGALTLAIVVVLAASVGGRIAGLVTSVVAALSFNFFMIAPYYTFRIDAGSDLVAVVLLAFIGVVVGVGAERRGMAGERAAEDIAAIDALSNIAGLVAEGRDRDTVWLALQKELGTIVGATTLRLVDDSNDPNVRLLPILDGRGTLHRPRDRQSSGHVVRHFRYTRRGLSLPVEGVAVALTTHGHAGGSVVIDTDPEVGSSLEHRVAAVAMIRLWSLAP